MTLGNGWLTKESTETKANSLISKIRRRVEKRRGSLGNLSTTNEQVAVAVGHGNAAASAVLRNWFFGSIGVVFDDGEKETWYVAESSVGSQFADLNVIRWTHWIGGVFTRTRNAVLDGEFPEALEYGPQNREALRELGPLVDYVIRDGKVHRFQFHWSDLDVVEPDEIEIDIVAEEPAAEPSFGLQSIIRTIDTAQNEQIRGPLQGVFILTGGPGVGKTTVALHRIPYLIDTHADPEVTVPDAAIEVTETSTMVVVWKKHLVGYLKQCLDHLGLLSFPKENVTLIDDWIALQIRMYVQFGHDGYRLSQSPGQVDSLKLLLTENQLFDFMSNKPDLRDATDSELERYCDDVQAVFDDASRFRAVTSDILDRHKSPMSPRNISPRINQLLRVLETWNDRPSSANELIDRLKRLQKLVFSGRVVGLVRAFYLSKAVTDVLESENGSGEAERFQEAIAAEMKARKITPADRYFILWMVESQDAADLLSASLEPLSRYAHVMIDEAQYYEPVVLRLLAHLAQLPHGTMTIVGDLEQRITARGGLLSWEDAGLQVAPDNVNRLDVNYRWSQPVFDFLEAYKDVASIRESLNRPRQWYSRNGSTPEVATFDSVEEEWIAVIGKLSELRRAEESSLWTIAVVVPDEYRVEAERRYIPELNDYAVKTRWASGEDVKDSVFTVVVTDFDSIVGLEFNAVFVLGLNDILADSDRHSLQAVWVALTRARQFLFVSRVGRDAVFDNPAFERYRDSKV